jgi:hypothetical protein
MLFMNGLKTKGKVPEGNKKKRLARQRKPNQKKGIVYG